MPILLIKPSLITRAKREELARAGYTILEIENFSDVSMMDEMGTVKPDSVLVCALEALEWGNDATCRNEFGKRIREKILNQTKAKKAAE